MRQCIKSLRLNHSGNVPFVLDSRLVLLFKNCVWPTVNLRPPLNCSVSHGLCTTLHHLLKSRQKAAGAKRVDKQVSRVANRLGVKKGRTLCRSKRPGMLPQKKTSIFMIKCINLAYSEQKIERLFTHALCNQVKYNIFRYI